MSSRAKLDSNMTLEAIQAASAGLKQLRGTMTFLTPLSPDERSQYAPHAVGRGLQVLEDRLSAAQEHPDLLPASFDLRQFKRDAQLTVALRECQSALKDLLQDVDDTVLVIGSRSVEESNLAYGHLKLAPAAVSKGARRSRRLAAGASAEASNPTPVGSGGVGVRETSPPPAPPGLADDSKVAP